MACSKFVFDGADPRTNCKWNIERYGNKERVSTGVIDETTCQWIPKAVTALVY